MAMHVPQVLNLINHSGLLPCFFLSIILLHVDLNSICLLGFFSMFLKGHSLCKNSLSILEADEWFSLCGEALIKLNSVLFLFSERTKALIWTFLYSCPLSRFLYLFCFFATYARHVSLESKALLIPILGSQ